MSSNMRLTDRQRVLVGQLDRDPFTEFGKRERGNPVIDGRPMRRPSGMSKTLDDANGLVKWKTKMVAVGAARSPMLLDQLRAIDPDDFDMRFVLNDLIEELAQAGGSKDAAEYGALIHALLEVEDRAPLPFRWDYDADLLAEIQADPHFVMISANYHAKMDELGFVTVPELVEVPLVSEELGTAGTCDRIVRLPDARTCVFDLKTNEGSIYPAKFLGWVTQLHVYASADFIYDPETDTKTSLPDGFDRSTGFICVVDRSSTEVDVYEIDLRQGSEVLELARRVTEVRSGAVRWAKKLTKPLPAGQTDLDVVMGRIAILRDAEGFGLEHLMSAWQAAGLPRPDALTEDQWPLALAVTEEACERASFIPASLDEANQRLANLPDDLRNGVEIHGKWCNRSITEEDTDAARLQAGIDLQIAESAFDRRKGIVHAAAERIPAETRSEFVGWLKGLDIDVADPHSWSKACVRSIDALSAAVADGLVSADGGDLDSDDVLKRVRKKLGKEKTPVNDECKNAAKWLKVKSERGFDAWLSRPEIVSYVLFADESTP